MSIIYYQGLCYQPDSVLDEEYLTMGSYILDVFPNPFNSQSTIEINIPQSSNITIKIYDTSGKFVSAIVKERLPIGTHKFILNGSNLASGTYFISIETDNKIVASKKIVLMK